MAPLDTPTTDSMPVDAAPCVTPLLAAWSADGSGAPDEGCATWIAESRGPVMYGEGRSDLAWQLRSSAASPVGTDGYLTVPASEGLVLDALTIDAWIRPAAFNAYAGSNRILLGTTWVEPPSDYPLLSAGHAFVYVHENGDLIGLVKVGEGDVGRTDWGTCTFGRLPEGVWQRVTVTYDGTLRCLLNGAPMDEVVLPRRRSGPIGALVIGRNFPGDIDALRIWSRALTPAEVAIPW